MNTPRTGRLFLPALAAVFLAMAPAFSLAGPAAVAEQVNQWRQDNEQEIVDGFVELLSLPNVASDSVNIRRNADYISGLLKQRDFDVRLLETAHAMHQRLLYIEGQAGGNTVWINPVRI